MGLSGPYYFSRPFRAAPPHDGRYFLFRRISQSRWSLALPSHCIRILLSSLSIFNLLSHISGPPVRAALVRDEAAGGGGGGGGGGGRKRRAGKGIMRIWERIMWENLAREVVSVVARRRVSTAVYSRNFTDGIRSRQKERARSAAKELFIELPRIRLRVGRKVLRENSFLAFTAEHAANDRAWPNDPDRSFEGSVSPVSTTESAEESENMRSLTGNERRIPACRS